MFAFVTGNWRQKAGAILVTLYALCLVTPAAALAATEQPVSAHCLGEHHHAAGAAGAADIADHDHTGTTQDQPGHDDHGQQEKCCGLFGGTALAPESSVVTAQITPSADIVMPRPHQSLLGSGGERIDRPPRDLLSL